MRERLSTRALVVASASHPRRVIAAWAVTAVLAIVAIGALLGGSLSSDNHPTDNRESQRAAHLIDRSFRAGSRVSAADVILVRSERYTADAPQFRTLVNNLQAPGVERNREVVSRDRHAVLIPVDTNSDGIDGVIAAVDRADANPAFGANITGDQTRQHDFNQLSQDDLRSGELEFGIPAALIILLLVFGAVVAGLIPLVMAMFSIIIALGMVAVLAHAFELSVFVVNMLTGMGLALGIDYALFVISRYREERGRGREKFDAIAASSTTANRAVVFSGTAFVVAMLGMLIVPNSIMRSLAIGAILVGIVSVIAATTLLPALLGLLGDGVDRLRLPLVGRRSWNPEASFWGTIVGGVLRRPVLSLGLSLAVLLAAASPIFGMHVGTSGVSALPDRFESRQGYAALQRNFPGATASPVEIVVANRPAQRSLAGLQAELAADPDFGPGQITRSPDGVALLLVPVKGDPRASTRSTRCATCGGRIFLRARLSAASPPRTSTTSTRPPIRRFT
jgi:uncharacterized membrane protein YdfJ with MMPL/SSD domain